MNDNSEETLERLFESARKCLPDSSGPERNFETRLIARIREEREMKMQVWSRWVWRRLVPLFTVIVVGLGIWNMAFQPTYGTDLHAAITGDQEDAVLIHLLTEE